MFKKSLLALTLFTAVAHAQVDSTPTPTPGPTVGTGDVFQKGTLGISLPLTLLSNIASAVSNSEPVPTIDIVYFLDPKAAIDIIGGINVHHKTVVSNATPPTSMDTTIFGFALGLGYRMYTHKDKLHAFIEPSGVLSWADTSDSAAFQIRLAGVFGAERTISDWFSLSGAIGGGLNLGNKFKDIQLAPVANLAANFYWH